MNVESPKKKLLALAADAPVEERPVDAGCRFAFWSRHRPGNVIAKQQTSIG